jgi:osmotically inducible protein OsmC
MSIATRITQTTWHGPLASGTGSLGKGSSGALDDLEVTWAARTEQPGGRTSPEELMAAGHSSCFSMALALCLGQHGSPPKTLEVAATVTLDEVDGRPTITTSQLQVRAQVPGLDPAEFAGIVDEAAALCPVSRLFAGAEITVEATLDES